MIALTARQMRVTLMYAVLSGLATSLVRPVFAIEGGRPPTMADSLPHLLAVAAVACGSASYGAWGFSRSHISTAMLAARLGFGPVFFGGVIAAAISVPYQVLRPPEMFPLSTAQLTTIVVVRLMILPVLAGLAVAALRPVFRRIDL